MNKILNRCDQAAAFSYCALIYFLPISIALCEVFATFTLVFFFLKRIIFFVGNVRPWIAHPFNLSGERIEEFVRIFWKSFKPETSVLSLPLGIYIFICFISIFISQIPHLSVSAFFFKILQVTYLYFVFIECMKTRARLKAFILAMMASTTLMAFDGLYQMVLGKEFVFGQPIVASRVTASFRHPNDFGAYLLMMIPILMSVTFYYRPERPNDLVKKSTFPWRIKLSWSMVTFIIFTLALLSLGWTYSRGAWFGFLFALLLFGIQNKRIFLMSVITLSLFLFIFLPRLENTRSVSMLSDILISSGLGNPSQAIHESEPLPSVEVLKNEITKFSGSGRMSYWMETIHIIEKFPFLGTGLNTYSHVAPKFKITWGGYAHNCYLQMAAEIGIIGLLSFLWIFLRLFIYAFRQTKLNKDSYFRSISFGAYIGLFGFMIHSAVDTNFYSVQLANLMWVVMGLIVALNNKNVYSA